MTETVLKPVEIAALQTILKSLSPRWSPPPTPMRSTLIHVGVMAAWVVLFVMAFSQGGLLAWSTGLVYVLYDTALLLFTAWKTLTLLRPQRVPPSLPRCSVGIIVAAHNEAASLPLTLAALLAQTDPPDQIVIADDGSTDSTPDLLAARYGLIRPELGRISAPAAAFPSLRWLRLPHGGKARALNAAILQLETDSVVTVDGDTLLERTAIAALRIAFATEPGLVAASGVLTPVCGDSLGGRFFQWFQTYEYIRNFLSRYAWARMDSLLLISGAFAGFRRGALLEVGGFDADCLVEDYELIHRLRRYAAQRGLGWTTRVIGGARARTDAPASLMTFLRQRRRWFGGFLQTQYWYRDMVGDRRYGWLGTLMLPVKAIDTFQPIYGLTALAILLLALVQGRAAIFAPVAGVIALKIGIDLAFHLWSVHLYRRWVGGHTRANFGLALLAAIAEPFSFQVLRHAGAVWGWVAFLSGRNQWGKQQRSGLVDF